MLRIDVSSNTTKSETETLRSELQKKALSQVLNALINIFSYLEVRKSANDANQKYRQNYFIYLIYSIYYSKISTYCELEDYLYRMPRVSELSQGSNSTDYLDLTRELYHVVVHSTNDFSALSFVASDFIGGLQALATKGSFSSHFLTTYETTISNLRMRIKPPLSTPLTSQQLINEIDRLDITTFPQLYSATTDATIRTLLTVAFYNKHNKFPTQTPDTLMKQTLLRLKKTTITTLSELQRTHRLIFSTILFSFGLKLVANQEEGYQRSNREKLFEQALASNSEAERLVLLAATQELNKKRFLSPDDWEPLPTDLLTWHDDNNDTDEILAVKLSFLTNQLRRCFYVDLMLIKNYLSYQAEKNDSDQMFRRRDFFKIIFYIHYGLIDSIQSLELFIQDPKRRERLQAGVQFTRYDKRTETFFARAKACDDFADIKNSCAA